MLDSKTSVFSTQLPTRPIKTGKKLRIALFLEVFNTSLHPECRGFESLSAHQPSPQAKVPRRSPKAGSPALDVGGLMYYVYILPSMVHQRHVIQIRAVYVQRLSTSPNFSKHHDCPPVITTLSPFTTIYDLLYFHIITWRTLADNIHRG